MTLPPQPPPWFLDTTPESYAGWLCTETEWVQDEFEFRQGPTTYILHRARGVVSPLPMMIRVEMMADECVHQADDPEVIVLGRSRWVGVEFKLLRLGENRTEVRAEFCHPVFAPYFAELLEKTAARWPESRAEIEQYRRVAFSKTDAALANSTEPKKRRWAQHVPTRPKERATWKRRWLMVRPTWEKTSSYAACLATLESYPNLQCSMDTLQANIRAGEAGRFE